MKTAEAALGKNQFGTFGGVFTPSILTIFGVIMFMRTNYVVGQAGVRNALLILLIAKSITFFTTLSLSAIATNMQVKGGGAYFIISRVLGPEFGGSIGIALFWAQALSGPFYILGFTEALVSSFPALAPHFQMIAIFCAALLFIITFIGAGWAMKIQFAIMAVLLSAIVAYMAGAFTMFDFEMLSEHWQPAYTIGDSGSMLTFWAVFAIFFPAVTGIMAGVNMSGDLKDPSWSIPAGTLAAIVFSAIVYALQIVVCGGAFSRDAMVNLPYETLRANAAFNLGPLVAAGVFAATLSSALGSFLGAPRILQAVARDDILGVLAPFSKGSAKGDEPQRATALTALICLGVFLWAGNHAGGSSLNIVAGIITMFFLMTYGMVNLAAFTEAYGGNPSFRPKFKFFHWSTALFAMLGCAGAALLIDPMAAVISAILLAGLLWYIRTRKLNVAFGDARRGFIYSNVRENLIRLSRMPDDDRNWRPTILAFTGNPAVRADMARMALWLEGGKGIVFMATILVGDLIESAKFRQIAIKQMSQLCQDSDLKAFPIVTVAPSFPVGFSQVVQIASMGPIVPNLVMLGWSGSGADMARINPTVNQALAVDKSVIILRPAVGPEHDKRRIDIWWRGMGNGSLMLILAYLVSKNFVWSRSKIRIIRIIGNEEGREPALIALETLIKNIRVDATAVVIVSSASFKDIFHENSSDASIVFMGFEPLEDKEAESWYRKMEALLTGMPATLLVCSKTQIDIY